MPLANVTSLLSYHNYVTGERAVETISRMIDYVQDGNRLFYDIYSDEDKRADARKNNTGLFFFRGVRHGFGLGIGTTAEGWEKDAVRFWEKYRRSGELVTNDSYHTITRWQYC